MNVVRSWWGKQERLRDALDVDGGDVIPAPRSAALGPPEDEEADDEGPSAIAIGTARPSGEGIRGRDPVCREIWVQHQGADVLEHLRDGLMNARSRAQGGRKPIG